MCSIVLELCGNSAALSGSSLGNCRMPTLMALGKMLREGFDPSAPAEIYERENAFLEEAKSGFSVKQNLMSQCVCVHINSFVSKNIPQRGDAQCIFHHIDSFVSNGAPQRSDVQFFGSTNISNIHLFRKALLRGVMFNVFFSHRDSLVSRNTPQRRLPI